MGTTDHRGRDLVTTDEAAEILDVHRTTVLEYIKRGELQKVKVPGIRQWHVTVESIDDLKAVRGMSLRELSVRLLKLERTVRKLVNDKIKDRPGIAHPTVLADTAEAEHDSTAVRTILKRLHPEDFH